MLAAQAIYGPDDSAACSSDSVTLGRALSLDLPEDIFDRGPSQSPEGNLVLTADARIDNRYELCADIHLSGPDSAVLGDAAVVLCAWRRWGERAIERLASDFAIAVWNRRECTLTLARDFAGARPLHYHRSAGFFAFASMPKGLHALPEIPRDFDKERALDYIRMLPDNGPRSYFAGIERVEPGQIVTVTPTGVATRRYWSPPVRKLRLRNREEYAEGLRNHLDRAVRSRLRGLQGQVATHLSAGLDSSSVTATAKRPHKRLWADRLLLGETVIFLALASVTIAILPFRVVAFLASGRWLPPRTPPASRTDAVARIRWAVSAMARRVPFRAVCIHQGLAAQIMLRRRGIPSLLYYGAAQDKALGLIAHVWVRDGELDVTGCEEAPRFALLARFPEEGAGT
jgi:asparagine synthetase B (glutamine-hydrolysing)